MNTSIPVIIGWFMFANIVSSSGYWLYSYQKKPVNTKVERMYKRWLKERQGIPDRKEIYQTY